MNYKSIIFPLLCCSLAFAQSALPVFQSNTNLQSIAVQVTDNRGNHVQGLTAANFTLLENGNPRNISFFGTEEQPVSLAVLVDSSMSMAMAGKLEQARVVLEPLLRGNRAADEIFLMQFDDKVGRFHPRTLEQRARPPALEPLLGSGGTAFYDALATGLCHMRTAQNLRQAVVVITDGADQHSRLDLERLILLAGSSSAQVFTIGFFSKEEQERFRHREKTVTLANGREIDNPMIVFERLSKESGAESFFPASRQDFQKALDRISAILKAQYTLAYYPASLAGLRRIEVKVNRPGLRVSSRRTLGSDSTGEPVHFSATGCEVSAKLHPFPWELRTAGAFGARVYKEDFTDARSGWPNRQGDATAPQGKQIDTMTTSRYVGRGYELSRWIMPGAAQSRLAEGAIAAYGPWWSNFRATAFIEANSTRIRNGVNLSDSAAGIVFRVSSPGYYAFLFSYGGPLTPEVGGRKIAFTLVKRFWYGPPSDIIPWSFIDHPQIKAGATGHKLSVESHRWQIVLFVDDVEVGRVKDESYESGQVGFGIYGNGRMTARDLLVEDLP